MWFTVHRFSNLLEGLAELRKAIERTVIAYFSKQTRLKPKKERDSGTESRRDQMKMSSHSVPSDSTCFFKQ